MTRREPLNFLFATAHLGGNVSPVMPVVQQLVAAGHAVRFMSDDVNRADAQAAGARFRSWVRAPNRVDRAREGDPPDWSVSDKEGIGMVAQFLAGTALAYAEDTIEELRREPADLVVGTGYPRAGHRLLTVGTDCSVGKMYATLALTTAMRERGVAADFRATGQTGILIAGDGIPLDAVVADFISGAIERLAPARHDSGWDLIEGQGSLFHPSFAGVSTGLLHGAQPEAIVLCHDPARSHMRGLPGRDLPDLAECLAANLQVARLTSPNVRAVGVCLNTSALDTATARRLCAETEDALGLPCTDPIAFGVEPLIDEILCTAPSRPSQSASR